MLWLAGLMGLMAVGTVTFVDPQLVNDDDDEGLPGLTTDPDASGAIEPLTALNAPEDNIDTDYDPRGGDDAALLPLLDPTAQNNVTLTEGGEGNDQLDGNQGDDRIRGQGGADTLQGGLGNDELRGGTGDDTLTGNEGNDTLHGQDGRDLMYGGDQDDALFGHNAHDVLFGEAGDDTLQGSEGHDILDGGSGNDTLQGGLDNDTLTGGTGNDALFGGWGNDMLNGLMRNANGVDSDESDFLNGGGGNDSILAGAGDIITTGNGADEIVLGDWISSNDVAQILDYAAADDSLILVWDDSDPENIEPQVTVSPDPDASEQTRVFMDGNMVATVNGNDLVAADIALIPLSTATQVGLTT